jgi:hypothetical protein
MGYFSKNSGLIGTGHVTPTGVHDIIATQLSINALYPFTSVTFTNGSTTGQYGPTQSDLLANYNTSLYPWLNDSLYFTEGTYQGFQKWTVPQSGNYEFVVIGASGGQKTNTSFQGGNYRPMAAVVTATYSLIENDKIQLIVGQRGEDDGTYYPVVSNANEGDNSAPGGGGASWVFFDTTDAEPLIVAGAGGGGSKNSGTQMNASVGTDGKNSQSTTNSTNFGTGGYGSRVLANGGSYWSAGGAGWKSDGTGGNVGVNYVAASPSYANAGQSPANSAIGGTRHDDNTDSGGNGGFGGGGGGGSDNMGTGGGGGYSGGGGSNSTPPNAGGGGGGSYSNSSNRIGSATIAQHTVWNHGSIQITLV